MATKDPQILSPKGFRGMVLDAYEKRITSPSVLNSIAWRVDSNAASEVYPFLGGIGGMREYKGGRQASQIPAYDFEIKNRHWEKTIKILKEHIRRDKTGQLAKYANNLAKVAAEHPLELVIALLNTNGKAFDGQDFFSQTHSYGDSGTIKNHITATEYAGVLNVATPTAPTANEMADVIMTMVQHQFTYKNDAGRTINGTARAFQLWVPINMLGATVQAVSKNMLNTGSGSRDNPLIGSGYSFEVCPMGDLSATDELILFRTDDEAQPFVWQEEVPVDSDTLWLDSEHAKKHDHVEAWVEGWYNVGYGNFLAATRAKLS